MIMEDRAVPGKTTMYTKLRVRSPWPAPMILPNVSVSVRDEELAYKSILLQRLLLPIDLTLADVPVRRPESIQGLAFNSNT